MPTTTCCRRPNLIPYNIKHSFYPISLSGETRKAIDTLLWYAPEIDSMQSKVLIYLNSSSYNSLYKNYICHSLGLSNDDFIIYDAFTSINHIVNNYKNKYCNNCQKIFVVKRRKSETLMQCLLNHLRNSIAHGFFTIHNGYFIAFDARKEKKGNYYSLNDSDLSYSAFFMLKLDNFFKIIDVICTHTPTYIIRNSFINANYLISSQSPNFFVAKNYKQVFNVCIVKPKGSTISKKRIQETLQKNSPYKEPLGRILLIAEAGKFSAPAFKYANDKGMIIINENHLIELMNGYDILLQY